MSRRFTLVSVAALGVALAAQVWAQPPHAPGKPGNAFLGYWVGVDPLDGGDSRRSLVRLDDGRFAIAGRDTVLTLCDETDRGFASFDDGVLVGRDELRTRTLTIACTNTGAAVVLHATYELAGDGLMIEHSTTPDGAPGARGSALTRWKTIRLTGSARAGAAWEEVARVSGVLDGRRSCGRR
jgi:hypothetical protein